MAATGNEAVTLAQLKSAQSDDIPHIQTVIKQKGVSGTTVSLKNGCTVTLTGSTTVPMCATVATTSDSIKLVSASFMTKYTSSDIGLTARPPAGKSFDTSQAYKGSSIGIWVSGSARFSVDISASEISAKTEVSGYDNMFISMPFVSLV